MGPRWRRFVDFAKVQMRENQFLSAGVWIGALGGIGGGLYVLCIQGADMASRAFYSSVTIRNKDEAFLWVTGWIAQNSDTFVTNNRLQVRVGIREGWEQYGDPDCDNPVGMADAGEVLYEPDTGVHVFTFKGKTLWMQRITKETLPHGYSRIPFTPETLTLTCFGGCDTLKDFIAECQKLAKEKSADKIPLYVADYNDWKKVASKRSRPLDSLVLPGGELGAVIDDVKKFLHSEERYHDLGVPYRRGYLFHGPPGSGKSSLASGIASALQLGVCCISLNSRGMDDTRLAALLRESPPNSLLLLEDVDCIFRQRGAVPSPGGGSSEVYVTFSGLLNAIDGVASQEGRILVMTTNHIEHIDKALLRPGRCDYKLRLGYATPHQALRLMQRFFPEAPLKASEEFASAARSGTLSMASMQCHLLRSATPEAAAAAAAEESLANHDRQADAQFLPLSAAQFLREVGLAGQLWPFYSRGMKWASEIDAFAESPEFSSAAWLSAADKEAVQRGLSRRKQEEPLVSEAQVRAAAAQCQWEPDAGSLSALANRVAGKVEFEVFHAFLSGCGSLAEAAAGAAELVADPQPLPDGAWKGAPDWGMCQAAALHVGSAPRLCSHIVGSGKDDYSQETLFAELRQRAAGC